MMSVSSQNSTHLTGRFKDALPSITARCRHTEIWGIDLKHTERMILDAILEKFLAKHSAIPRLQLSRAIFSFENTLEWRRFSDPRALLTEAESILPELDLCHVTFYEDNYVLWVSLDEMAIKGYSAIYENMTTSKGLVWLGLAVLEQLSTLLLRAAASHNLQDYSASCVVEFKVHEIQNAKKQQSSLQKKLCNAIGELATFIRSYYPNMLGKVYIINPREDYLAPLDIDESMLRNTVLLDKPEELRKYLGSQVPTRYGGSGEPFAESDLLHRGFLAKDAKDERTNLDRLAVPEAENTEPKSEPNKVEDSITTNTHASETLDAEEQKPRLVYSETIGPPSIILDPDDLQTAVELCPDKMGARVVFADSDTVVKFGHGVRLAEAEALHLASTRTTIVTPKLLSAYILDGVTYIVMSYEEGEPFHQYWDHASEAEQDRILDNLRDYVKQMHDIPGDFIGALDRSPCLDGIFEVGYGDYTKYSYGPYPSEESFNEGIIQALRDRLPPKVLESENDLESKIFNSEYRLYQTVRELKNHKIVFTHADIHPGNMIVRSDGTVVLLDWGLAGFWPEYWEFYRAMHNPSWKASWDRMVEKFIPPFYIEYEIMERVFATAWN